MSRILSLAVAILTLVLFAISRTLEQILGIIPALLVALSMIWFPLVWARYVLTVGFWEYFARDFNKDETYHAYSMIYLGWAVLIVLFLFVIF